MLRMNFNFITPLLVVAGFARLAAAAPVAAGANLAAATSIAAGTVTTAPASGPGSRDSSLRRAVALLDYVAGDYARAVGEGGQILAADEYREQLGFVAEAARELRGEGGD